MSLQLVKKHRLAAVVFVERQPIECQTVDTGAGHLLERDPPLRPIEQIVGDLRFLHARDPRSKHAAETTPRRRKF